MSLKYFFGASGGKEGTIIFMEALSIFFFFFPLLFTATPVAHGRSWPRGLIGAAAAGYIIGTAMPDPSHICDLQCSLWQQQILNSLSEARDHTHILMETTLGP